MSALLKKLQRLRNHIVHASWESKNRGKGLIAAAMDPKFVDPSDTATGYGFPKRGRDPIVRVEWTAAQIMAVADLIEESRGILSELANRKPATSPRVKLAHTLRNEAIQRRIAEMRDRLPDPFPKLRPKGHASRFKPKGT